MKTLLKIAWRNLFRQKARLALNLTLLVGAFCVIVVFEGFAAYVLATIRDIMTATQVGDLQVAKTQLFNETPVDSASEKLMADHNTFLAKIRQMPEVLNAGARLEFFGLANTEDKSIPVRVVGFQPEIETRLQPTVLFKEGNFLKGRKEAVIGFGMQKSLKVKVGEDITIVSQSLAGGMNAMDLKVVGVVATGFTDIDDSTLFVNLEDAQKVLDTDSIERILIHLKAPSQYLKMKSKLKGMNLPQKTEVREWRMLSNLYVQVEDFYVLQNFIVEGILILLIFLSVSNATNITVFERLGEIGTLRAIGDFETDIQKLFLVESILLGLVTICIGFPLSYIICEFISAAQLKITMPMASEELPVQILLTSRSFLVAACCCLFSVVLASLWPARRGATTPITTALRAKV